MQYVIPGDATCRIRRCDIVPGDATCCIRSCNIVTGDAICHTRRCNVVTGDAICRNRRCNMLYPEMWYRIQRGNPYPKVQFFSKIITCGQAKWLNSWTHALILSSKARQNGRRYGHGRKNYIDSKKCHKRIGGGWPQSEYFIVNIHINIHVNIHVNIASPTSSIRKLQVCLSYMIAILFLKNHGS